MEYLAILESIAIVWFEYSKYAAAIAYSALLTAAPYAAVIAYFAFVNRIRGGMFAETLKGKGDDLAGVLFGIGAAILLKEWWVLPAFAVAFRLGESHGWGHWLSIAVTNKGHNPRLHESPIDNLLTRIENKNLWALAGLTIRGALWGAILAVPAFYITPILALYFFLAGAMMGLVFFSTRLIPISFNKRWELGEYIMGALFGVCFLLIL
jgi:hypothetical protein